MLFKQSKNLPNAPQVVQNIFEYFQNSLKSPICLLKTSKICFISERVLGFSTDLYAFLRKMILLSKRFFCTILVLFNPDSTDDRSGFSYLIGWKPSTSYLADVLNVTIKFESFYLIHVML